MGLCVDKVETVVERAEQIVDTVEKVAEKVEQVAEGVLQNLPAGNLKNVVSVIENVAEKTGDGAELIGDLIDKVSLIIYFNIFKLHFKEISSVIQYA